jgi:hypothetical protein
MILDLPLLVGIKSKITTEPAEQTSVASAAKKRGQRSKESVASAAKKRSRRSKESVANGAKRRDEGPNPDASGGGTIELWPVRCS